MYIQNKLRKKKEKPSKLSLLFLFLLLGGLRLGSREFELSAC